MSEKVPDVLIEQLFLDELPENETKKLLARADVQKRLTEIKASNSEILSRYSPEMMSRLIEARLASVAGRDDTRERTTVKFRRVAATVIHSKAAIPLLAAALLLLTVGVGPLLMRSHEVTDTSSVRIKGIVPLLHVYRETSAGVEQLKNGATVRPKDLLQISYVAAGEQYGMIFSIDGSGSVTLHLPDAESALPRLQKEGEIALPYSYELDNAPRFERFYFVTSQSAFSVRQVMQEAQKAARQEGSNLPTLTLSRGLSVTTFTVYKGAN